MRIAMDWAHARRKYGLQHPYNFNVVIPFLLNLLLAILVFASGVILFSLGKLRVTSALSYFHCYLIILSLLAAALSRRRFVTSTILVWCLIESFLALTDASLRPKSYFGDNRFTKDRYQYHALLHVVPKPNWQGAFRLDERDSQELGAGGWRINWPVIGGEVIRASHNSLGLRGPELSEADLKRRMIFVYGGSTTYDVLVTQGKTWVELVQSELRNEFTLLNFGVAWHTTAENLSATIFYQRIAGKRPACAVYYVGWNDVSNAYFNGPDPAYADSFALIMIPRQPDLYFADISPVVNAVDRMLKNRFDSTPTLSKHVSKQPIPDSVDRVESSFTENIATIATVNHSRSVKTVFIGQVLNRNLENLPGNSQAFTAGLWRLQKRFNETLRTTALAHGASYIEAGDENFHTNDFADQGHFAATGSKTFAAVVAPKIEDYCR